MNILIVNWTWYNSGGDWTYIENLRNLYEQKGHKVIPFSMQDKRNHPTLYSKYFIKNIDYKELNKNKSLVNYFKVLTKSIYSFEAKLKLKNLLKNERIDIAHLQNIHHYLTPSIISVFRKYKIPIIWTLNDYTVLCPETVFLSNGQICEECKGGKFYNCTIKKCKKESFLASFAASIENYIHHLLNLYDDVDYFICGSKFVYNKFLEFGFKKNKLKQIYYCYDINQFDKFESISNLRETEKYIVFVGRIAKEKGIETLLYAMKELPEIRLKIIGFRSQEKELKVIRDSYHLHNVDFLIGENKEEVFEHIKKSEFLVCPSEWYEVFGYVIVEAMLLGKPVIGSRIGAIPELVIENLTGLLFDPGNVGDLSEKINKLYYNKEQITQYGKTAKSHINNIVSFENHINELKKIIPNL